MPVNLRNGSHGRAASWESTGRHSIPTLGPPSPNLPEVPLCGTELSKELSIHNESHMRTPDEFFGSVLSNGVEFMSPYGGRERILRIKACNLYLCNFRVGYLVLPAAGNG